MGLVVSSRRLDGCKGSTEQSSTRSSTRRREVCACCRAAMWHTLQFGSRGDAETPLYARCPKLRLQEPEPEPLHRVFFFVSEEHRVLVRGLRLDLDKARARGLQQRSPFHEPSAGQARRELSDERGRICATERVRPISSSSRFVRIVFTRRVQHCVMAADTFRGLGSRHLPLCMFCPCPFLLGSWKWLRRDTRQRWPPPQSWR